MTNKTTLLLTTKQNKRIKYGRKTTNKLFFVGENVKNMKRNKQNRHFC